MTSSDFESIPRHRALAILLQCDGDHVWSEPFCRQRGIPESWVRELADAHESGFERDHQTLYVDGGDAGRMRVTNQYHGVHDRKLALRIAEQFGLDVDRVTAGSVTDRQIVRAIQDAVEEGE